MRIISKFKDYYDGVSIHDATERLVYVRHTGIFPSEATPNFIKHVAPSNPLDSKIAYIAFCGKLYVMYLCPFDNTWHIGYPELVQHVLSMTPPEFYGRNDCENAKKHFQSEKFLTQNGTWSYNDRFSYRSNMKAWEHWIENYSNQTVDLSFHIEYKTPVFAYAPHYDISWAKNKFILNPRLADYNFYKHVDAYTAYQEIDMFLGNQMVDQFDPSVGRTDNEIRDSKGFDNRSFRKDSPKPKRRKRK